MKPTLAAVDHEGGRVWSNALEDKTILGGTGWIQKRLAQDIDNAGYKEVKVMIKSARAKYMAPDPPDIAYAVKELARGNN